METKKIILIILTIIILGPVVFFGSCFPLGWGVLGIESMIFSGMVRGIFIWIVGIFCIALTIFVCYKVIKKIIKSK